MSPVETPAAKFVIKLIQVFVSHVTPYIIKAELHASGAPILLKAATNAHLQPSILRVMLVTIWIQLQSASFANKVWTVVVNVK